MHSASIPLTIATQLKSQCVEGNINLLRCGFGVGLSSGTVALNVGHVVISNMVEVEKNAINNGYK